MSDSVACVDGFRPRTKGVRASDELHVKDAETTTYSETFRAFVQDIDLLVCEKINTLPLPYTDLTPDRLRSQKRNRTLAMARRCCWYVLRNHPLTNEYVSERMIARIYSRKCPSTVNCGLQKTSGMFLDGRRNAETETIRFVSDGIAERYGRLVLETL